MEIFYGSEIELNDDSVVAFGKFDGIHEGHRLLIRELCETAKEHGLKSVIYTFDRNPKEVLSGEHILCLTSVEEKNEKLKRLGVDVVVYERFDEKFAQISPEEFVKEILLKKLSMKGVVMGSNSTFGKDGVGDISLMKKFGEKYGFSVKEVELLHNEGIVLSSTNIRRGILSDLR